MEPVTALGIAAGVIQLVDFAYRLTSKSYKAIHAISAGLATDDIVALADVASNLQELSRELETSGDPDMTRGRKQLKGPEKTLDGLRMDSLEISHQLLGTLKALMSQKSRGKWDSFRLALASVRGERDIRALETRLDRIRTKLDTTLLVCLRHKLEGLSSQYAGLASVTDIKSHFGNCDDWHAAILYDVHHKGWQADSESDRAAFATQLDKSARNSSKARFCRMVRRRLAFSEQYDREEQISKAHERTLNWLFEGSADSEASWDDFSEWLCHHGDGSRIYWITGKPGSGKSTLMKHICRDVRTRRMLKQWAGGAEVETAAFFFWNSGTKMQMSHLGLLRSLLSQMVGNDPSRILKAFPRRWELFDNYCAGLGDFGFGELRQAFETLTLATMEKWFFLIDGLDEFDGDLEQLTDLVLAIGERPNVKICIASRPWLVFGDAFEGKPSLRMEDLTKEDIRYYVTSSFNQSKHFHRLRGRQASVADTLLAEIVKKAEGVFLWVYLVVKSLLKSLSDCGRLSDLQALLDACPRGLDELFSKMLGSMEPEYLSHACQLIQIVEASRQTLTLLGLSFADEDDPAAALLLPVKTLSAAQVEDRTVEMERRLNSRCKGLLEAPARRGGQDRGVQYLHRTARDFLRNPIVWRKVTESTPEGFEPYMCLLNSSLSLLKILDPTIMRLSGFSAQCEECIGYANCITGHSREIIQYTYIDAMDRAAIELTTRQVEGKPSWLAGYTLPSQPHHWASTLVLEDENCLFRALRLPESPAMTAYACEVIRQGGPIRAQTAARLLAITSEEQIRDLIRNATEPNRRRRWWFQRAK
ncbi:hypothetical protein B0T19DRAFT_484129 [Cercophora scortea]|uniref:NACHT domain-containing protein n=1 Tax=Cercophora scortea TaxID=314031 RepID=A0AAE0MC95_9PEZI|nr:hypothetical protein B0T19DRAFT_484129 [Cercophora scortea]